MPAISDALNKFRHLLDYNYHFTVSSSKKLYHIKLTFKEKDFFHLAGFQYLTDIDIPKSSTQLFEKITNHKINDEYLNLSKNYLKVDNNYVNVKERIHGLQFLKDYIDSKNTIFQYIKNKNPHSRIRADFLIQSTISRQQAFIFLRKRANEESYCICSFFINPSIHYSGIRSYWLYKSCTNIKNNIEVIMINRLENLSQQNTYEETLT